MNKQLVDKWIEEFDLDADQAKLLERFSVLMDRNSLWLMDGQSSGGDIEFIYTDEAIHYKFSLDDMKELMDALDAGESLDWKEIDEKYTVPHGT